MADLRVLIVDDEESTVAICKFALQRLGMEVETALTASEALAKVRQEAFDLAVVDWLLPDGSGMALFRMMREHLPQLVGILITGQNVADTNREALEAGFWAFLPKPFTISEFQATVERAAAYIRAIRERERLELMISLSEVAQQIATSLETEEVLQRILHVALQQARADKVSIMLVDQSTSPPRLRLVAAEGLSPDLLSIEVPVGEGIAGQVALTGAPLLINAQTIQQFSPSALHYQGAGSALCLPLKVGNRVVGVLNLTKLTSDRPFSESDIRLYLVLAAQAALAIENAQLHQKIREGYIAALTSFCKFAETLMPYRQGHSLRVGIYAKRLAEVVGLSKQEAEQLRIAALMQDLGLLKVPKEVLTKPGKLTDDEWQLVKQHPLWSLELVDPPAILTETIELAVRHHHERFDGSGYPDGLKGEQIPLPARLLAVADTFDALCSERPYRPAYSTEQALEEMRRVAGSQLDPELTEAFVQSVSDGRDS
ncbi:response regulator [Fervidibacter sacchari]|uniref:Response regulator RpfG family c-di-GMP phosphodiesterase n=1 Tax=Candidatus Fervidibacter sacchari TaxID=1448929 RepID=A0ABT2ENE7_9BACT|nr:HD domain-containing phosphohydrolase [Candidatus Fervidibacter sacchari]MCS3919209.1 response regulator RpfG family c-di-GMP phosphodiesterase [Candidatus Fervidibacter sacchari]WKU17059.1 response regulator [Candidatus Fervidibacter sacchari]